MDETTDDFATAEAVSEAPAPGFEAADGDGSDAPPERAAAVRSAYAKADRGEAAGLTADELYGVMSTVDPEGAEALERQWGDNVVEEVGYARTFVDTLGEIGLRDEALEWASREGLADDPFLVKMCAALGRSLAPARRDATHTVSDRQARPAVDRDDLKQRMHQLTADLQDAVNRRDMVRAKRIDGERDAVARQIYGGGPIVGVGMRTS